jgi:hypothetical protein
MGLSFLRAKADAYTQRKSIQLANMLEADLLLGQPENHHDLITCYRVDHDLSITVGMRVLILVLPGKTLQVRRGNVTVGYVDSGDETRIRDYLEEHPGTQGALPGIVVQAPELDETFIVDLVSLQ